MRASSVDVWMLGVLATLSVGCGSEAKLAVGDVCQTAEPGRCETGICEDPDGFSTYSGICTVSCSGSEPCPNVVGIGQLTCHPASSYCDVPCSVNATVQVSGDMYVCRNSEFVACGDLTDDDCGLCGCEVFGGGVCLPVGGCVDPKADGLPCTYREECISGACYYDTKTCGAPRAINQTCYADEDCESANCSNDGDHEVAGVCNMAFGDRCTDLTDCNLCAGENAYQDGYCIRRYCNPDDETPCPTSVVTYVGDAGRSWDCRMGQDAIYRCYEDCTVPEGYYYNCLEDLQTCHESYTGNYCY